MPAPELPSAHRRRLRDLWRSAGWPCHDAIELGLLTDARGIELARPAPRRAMRLPFAVWMSLARSGADDLDTAEAGCAQAPLAAIEADEVGA